MRGGTRAFLNAVKKSGVGQGFADKIKRNQKNKKIKI
jgi:hypothetical protein